MQLETQEFFQKSANVKIFVSFPTVNLSSMGPTPILYIYTQRAKTNQTKHI